MDAGYLYIQQWFQAVIGIIELFACMIMQN